KIFHQFGWKYLFYEVRFDSLIFYSNIAYPQKLSVTPLRLNCYAVGAWMTKKGNSKVLKIAVPIKKRKWMNGIFSKVDECSFPLSLRN
ncbi:MAG: hypothetical protein ACOVLD_00200, partial [Bacteroidia bacterium]